MDKLNEQLKPFLTKGDEIRVDPASDVNPDYSTITAIDVNTLDPIAIYHPDEQSKKVSDLIAELQKFKYKVKEPAPWTRITAWVARDEDGRLYVHSKKPHRVSILGGWDSTSYMELDSKMFPDVTFDCDALQVSLLISPMPVSE